MNYLKLYGLFCCAMFAGGFASEVFAQSTMHTIETVAQSLHKLTWKAPIERENGDPLSEEEIVGYRVDRADDTGNVIESVELEGSVLELAINIIPGECNTYTAIAIATDGSPPTDSNPSPQTLESKPTDPIRLCIIPPKRPRDFQVQ
jgi:hypothetical protein